jgi:uncharacterized protein YqgC (DUF456 family)
METIDWPTLGTFGIYTVAALLCLLGFVLSSLSLSGTWLVFGATLLVAWKRWPDFPGITTLAVFLLLCIGVEVAEALAGSWGVKRRGGSKAAGWAALCGGFIGMLCGGFLMPVPVIGNLVGMLAGSFGAAFLIEHAKMKRADHAAHVATGAVLARLAVIFLKIGITLLMGIVLTIGLIRS